MRSVVLLLGSLVASSAPLQCAHEPEPELRRYETPPEALYQLAERFRAAGNDAARRDTLRFLVERYPSSRFAERAKAELAAGSASEGR